MTAALLRADSLEKHGLLDPFARQGARVAGQGNRGCQSLVRPAPVQEQPRSPARLDAGHAGLAWTAFDLATAVGDEVNQRRAVELAKALPVSWHIPDVYHGLAEPGLTLLHLWAGNRRRTVG